MPRLIDPLLLQALDRANPNVAHFVEVNAPDVGQVLRRATDQFLTPLSQTPANSLAADPAGVLTIASTSAALATFTTDDDEDVALPRTGLGELALRGLAWAVAPSFGRAIITKVTALIRRKNPGITNDLSLQIYRLTGAATQLAFAPVLPNPIIWKSTPEKWLVISPTFKVKANVEFDLTELKLELGRSSASPLFTPGGEEQSYYFVIEPLNATADDQFYWVRDRTSTRTVAGVGTFEDRRWFRREGAPAGAWQGDATIPHAVPCATVRVRGHDATAQAVYALTLDSTPRADSVGRIAFDRGVPAGAALTLELSTAGSGGPWTAVTDGDVVTTKQATYHLRVTMDATADTRLAPTVAAMGIQFAVPVDVTAEAIVEPISAEIGVPYCAAAIGEGQATVIRTGRRDYRDAASDLAAANASSKLEVEVRLGSRHPQITREHWLLVDRAFVSDRVPSGTSEVFSLLSYLKTLKQKIPARAESVNEIRTVTSADTDQVTVTPALPTIDGGYANRGFYMRVRSSSQAGIGTGYLQTIDNSSGTSTLKFNAAPLPGTLVAGDVVEIHSASYLQTAITWSDADPADVWLELLTVHCEIPLERIGSANLGRVTRGGYPPRVTDRESDPEVQKKLRVTLQLTAQENANELIDQVSFIMGGATVEIAGQIAFRQIYPLRDSTGQVVVPAEPIAATFDQRTLVGLNTPVGLEQRITQLACDYGVNTTAVGTNAPAALTTNFVDVDALAWLDDQPLDDFSPTAIDKKIARWCYNSADLGYYLASMLTQQVVRAASTGLRVWPWGSTEAQPQLVVGDRVTVITDQYTDYDPARALAIRGWYAYTLVVVSVQGGGTQFHGFMLGLSDAVQIRGGQGTLAADDGSSKGEILSVSYNDSVDGETRTYAMTCGPAVDRVYVHTRLWPMGAAGDPFDFSAAQNVTDTPEDRVVGPDPADGKFRFTLTHPPRNFEVPIVAMPRQGPPNFAFGVDQWNDVLQAAPPAINAPIHPARVDALASLSIDVAFGVSDGPVVVDVIEQTLTMSTIILSVSLRAGTTLDAGSYPELGNRPLPAGKDFLSWRVRVTDVAGQPWWFGPANASRDPLADATVTAPDYQPGAGPIIAFGPDTDGLRVTTSDGRMKTWDRATLDAVGSPVRYAVGDTLDDTTTEEALGVGDAREGYTAEALGGGTWTLIWGPATLHGQPQNPPTVAVRAEPNADRNAESVFLRPDTQVDEKLLLHYRLGITDAALEYVLCGGASDPAPLAELAGTLVGPSNFFVRVDGVGSPTAILDTITLTRAQITRHQVQAIGAESGMPSGWIDVVLSLMEQPILESFAAEWNEATGTVLLRPKGGAHTASVELVLSPNADLSSPIDAYSAALADGGDLTHSVALSGAQRGKVWYAGATPSNNATWASGLPGVQQVVQVAVPAITGKPDISVVETLTDATITVKIDDPGGVLDFAWTNGLITTALHFEVTDLGVTTTETHSTHGAVGTLHTWTKVITLDPLHTIGLIIKEHFLDGSTGIVATLSIDPDKIANGKATAANSGATSTVLVRWDTDALIGSNNARWSLDGGTTWVSSSITVTADYASTFPVTRTSAKQTVTVQAKNAYDGAYGALVTVDIDAYLSEGPSLTANYVRIDDTSGEIQWLCAKGLVTVSFDGGLPATPSVTPIAITLDSHTHTYLFEADDGGVIVGVSVAVPALSTAGGGGLFANLDNQVADYALNQLQFSWTYPDPAAAFDLYVSDDTGGVYTYRTRTSPGASSVRYTPSLKVLTSGTGSGTWAVGFYVRAVLSGTIGLQSDPLEETYHYV